MIIGVIADIHAAPAGSPSEKWQGAYAPAVGARLARDAVSRLNEASIDALIVLGDSANGGDQASLTGTIGAVSGCDVPTWIVAGNVDLRLSQTALEDALAASKAYPRIPTVGGEGLNGFILAGLRYRGAADDAIALDHRPDVASWGENAVLLVSHYPVISRKAEALAQDWRYSCDALGLEGLAEELATRSAPTIVLHGHLHLKDAVARGSLLQLGFPALIETGHEFAIVEIRGDRDSLEVEVSFASIVNDSRAPAAIGAPHRAWGFAANMWRPS